MARSILVASCTRLRSVGLQSRLASQLRARTCRLPRYLIDVSPRQFTIIQSLEWLTVIFHPTAYKREKSQVVWHCLLSVRCPALSDVYVHKGTTLREAPLWGRARSCLVLSESTAANILAANIWQQIYIFNRS